MNHMLRTLTATVALVIVAGPTAAERRWTVTGQEVPELAAIDQMVQQQMFEYDIRGASAAIVKDGRLVYARGFTWDDATVEPVQPTTLFRTGSIGKAIASIAVHQLIESGLLDYATLVASTLSLQPLPGEQVDPRLAGVTLDHLLTHTSGMHTVSVYEVDRLVAAAVGAGPPPTKREIMSYIIGHPFVFDSGTTWDYNNYGYIMLDQLVEHATGVPFAEYVLEHVFRKVGVGRARVAHQLPTDRAPTETTYDGLEGDPHAVSLENAVAAGGWVMAAPDMARLFSALFDSEDAGGLLERSTIEQMLELPFPASADLGYGRGWIQEEMFIALNHSAGWLTDPADGLEVYGHGGGGTGIHTLALWRSDGLVFVWFTNKDPIIPTIDFPAITSWPDHDLWETVGVSLEPVGSAPTESWIPIVASGPGAGDSFWLSDVGLLNRSSLSNRVRLRYRHGDVPVERELELAPRAAVTVHDVVGELGEQGSGPLQVFSSEPLTVTSRTFNQTPDGSYGQFLDGVTTTGGLEQGESAVLMQLREDAAFRTNIGLHNQWRRSVSVEVALYDGAGDSVATITQQVPPQSTVQLNRPFRRVAGRTDVRSGYAVVTVLSGQDVYAYASVGDNATNDPTTIPMQVGEGSPYQWVAAAAHNTGANGSQWRTGLSLLNRSGEAAEVEVTFHAGDRTSVSHSLVLFDGQQQLLEDVVAWLGADGAGSLEISGNQPILVSSRTFYVDAHGTFGQFIGGTSPAGVINQGETVWLPQLRQDGSFRTNIGVLNTGVEDAGVTIRLFDDRGVELASPQVRLEPGQRTQLQEPLARIAGRRDLATAYATVTVRFGAGVIAYGSVVDNTTHDPTTIWMKR